MFGKITYLTTVAVKNAIDMAIQNKTVWMETSQVIGAASKINRS
tara:strand:+ start:5213 stop:5344 length:132 start_codon:yes stop_codon:yes gene_type:complete